MEPELTKDIPIVPAADALCAVADTDGSTGAAVAGGDARRGGVNAAAAHGRLATLAGLACGIGALGAGTHGGLAGRSSSERAKQQTQVQAVVAVHVRSAEPQPSRTRASLGSATL